MRFPPRFHSYLIRSAPQAIWCGPGLAGQQPKDPRPHAVWSPFAAHLMLDASATGICRLYFGEAIPGNPRPRRVRCGVVAEGRLKILYVVFCKHAVLTQGPSG